MYDKIIGLINGLENSIEHYHNDRKDRNMPVDSLYAVKIMIYLILLAIEDNRPIKVEEESWFKGSYYIAQSFDGTEYESVYKYYQALVNEVKLNNYFRK